MSTLTAPNSNELNDSSIMIAHGKHTISNSQTTDDLLRPQQFNQQMRQNAQASQQYLT